METVAKTKSGPLATPEQIIWIMPLPGVAKRLARAVADTVQELSNGVGSYLRMALLPDRARDWFPVRVARLILDSAAHPVATLRGAVAAGAIELKWRRRLLPVLSISAAIHGALIIYLIYLAFFSAFAHVRVVNKAYRQFDPNAILVKLYYPPQILRQAPRGPAMTLEEIRARAEKHKQELAVAREKAEKERKAKEEAERKAAEEAAKAAAEKKPESAGLTEINTLPIKDMIGKLYELYQAGGLDIPDKGFSMMAAFKVERDGSLSNIRIIQPSPSKLVDAKALEILWNIGESHALGEVAVLSSATISLDLTEETARLRITAFAPSPEIAKEKADKLKALFWLLRFAQKSKSSDIAELLSMVRITSRGKFVDTDLIVPRARASQMMRSGFAKPAAPQ